MSYNKDTNWDNERKYLENLIKTGNTGEQSWAKNQLVAISKAQDQFGGTTTTPTATNPYGEDTDWENEYAYLSGLSKNGNAGEQAWANNQLDLLNDAVIDYDNAIIAYDKANPPKTNETVYTPAGTYNDSGLPSEALAQIQAYKKAYAEAIAKGDTAAAEKAHAAAEAIRLQYGYSGGEDGSEKIEIGGNELDANAILSWNGNYNTVNPQPTYTEPTVDGKSYSKVTENLLSEILSREDFSYNVENDPLYAQYKTMYNRESDRAMRDTLAEVASSAGGMNSYAVMAAQQANNYYNAQLNDKIPELYQLAYEMYLQDKASKVEDLGILTQLDQTQYDRYRDTMDDYWEDKKFAYGSFLDSVTQGNTEKTFEANEQTTAKNEVWKMISLGITPSADLIAKSGMSQIDVDLAVAAMQAGGTGYTGDDNTGGNGYTGGNNTGGTGGNDNTGFTGNTPAATGITEDIEKTCAGFETNSQLEDYLDSLAANDTITPNEADILYAKYKTENDISTYDEEGNITGSSYSDMVKNTKGWKIVDEGGGNLFGIDKDAIVKAPNGEQLTLNQLREKLKSEKMSQSEANKAIKALQQNLGISSNWLFGW